MCIQIYSRFTEILNGANITAASRSYGLAYFPQIGRTQLKYRDFRIVIFFLWNIVIVESIKVLSAMLSL